MAEQSQVILPIKRRVLELLVRDFRDPLQTVIELRAVLVDLIVSIQEQVLHESNRNSSGVSSGRSDDELGTLVELVTGEHELFQC
jgi:hypothetical protein